MTTSPAETVPAHLTDAKVAYFVENNRGVERAPASLELELASAADADERARAWRTVLRGDLL